MSTTTPAKTRTITLTDRQPVRIIEDEWPIIASAYNDSYIGSDSGRRHQALGQGEFPAASLTVRRQHQDGRVLVYGVLSAADRAWGAPAGGESWRGGELLAEGKDLALAIRRVGAAGNLPEVVIRACIADLPAEKL